MCMYMYMCKHVPFILLFSGDFACELFVIVDVRVFSQTSAETETNCGGISDH